MLVPPLVLLAKNIVAERIVSTTKTHSPVRVMCNSSTVRIHRVGRLFDSNVDCVSIGELGRRVQVLGRVIYPYNEGIALLPVATFAAMSMKRSTIGCQHGHQGSLLSVAVAMFTLTLLWRDITA